MGQFKDILCIFLSLEIVTAAPESSLRFVSLLYRHGDRSPADIYPKDINQVNNAWPDGLGWLTNIGKRQQYELGQYLKQRYDGFLNTSYYNHTEIYIESSGIERCLMSAYSNLAGLFPPLAAQLWNSDLDWQPIPVETRPVDTDNKLAESVSCPKYDQLFQAVLNSPEIKEEEEVNKEFYEMVEENTGIKKESIADFWAVADALECEKAHNLTWNDWVYQDGVWEKINDLQDLGFQLMYWTTEMARLKGGPLLKEIITNMKAAAETAHPLPKVHMYSAHDTTVASLLSAMHMFNGFQPMYRALVMVELHEVEEEHVVKVFYKNESTSEPFELYPEDCSHPCTLSDFIKATEDTTPVDWEKECEADDSPLLITLSGAKHPDADSLSAASIIAVTVGVGLVAFIIVAIVIVAVRHKSRGTSSYTYVNL